MTDLLMCKNRECQIRYDCYRYRAKENKVRQDYLLGNPSNNGNCSYYLRISERQSTNSVLRMKHIEAKENK